MPGCPVVECVVLADFQHTAVRVNTAVTETHSSYVYTTVRRLQSSYDAQVVRVMRTAL